MDRISSSPPVDVRECTPADAPTLAVIGSATLLEAYASLLPGDALLAHCAKHHVATAYLELMAVSRTRAWLAEVPPGAAPVGYAMITPPDFPAVLIADGDLELRRIYVFSRFHGDGTARRLMDRAIDEARRQRAVRLLLGVHSDNLRALAFYRKTGFVQMGIREFSVGRMHFVDPVLSLAL